MHWYFGCFRKYATFSGEVGRTEFWMFVLFDFIVMCVLYMIDVAMGMGNEGAGALSGIYSLVSILPRLAVAVRRLHYIGNSGWWILIGLIPIIGQIVLLVKYCTPSK